MRYSLVINLDRCTGCDSCVAGCKIHNGLELGVYRNHITQVGPYGDFPHLKEYFVPVVCQQCENAPCVEVCPTGATFRADDTGLVMIDQATCIGCQLCMGACPFGARHYDEDKGVVEKCVLCNWPAEGEDVKPFCAQMCCTGAITFGDLDDPESDASRELAKFGEDAIHALPDEAGAEPRVRYILSPKYADWTGEF